MYRAIRLLKDGKFLGYYPRQNTTAFNPYTLKGLYTRRASYWDETSISHFKQHLEIELAKAQGNITYEIIDKPLNKK